MAATPDKKTVIRDLIELGKSKGQLSTKEILDALGELDFLLAEVGKVDVGEFVVQGQIEILGGHDCSVEGLEKITARRRTPQACGPE